MWVIAGMKKDAAILGGAITELSVGCEPENGVYASSVLVGVGAGWRELIDEGDLIKLI